MKFVRPMLTSRHAPGEAGRQCWQLKQCLSLAPGLGEACVTWRATCDSGILVEVSLLKVESCRFSSCTASSSKSVT